jgi:predicted CopG family antitoxin
MADVERVGRKLSEIDRRVNMNATPEEFTKYLMKHNISITEEIFEEFKSMNRFRSFSDYIRKHRQEMGLKVILPGDKKVKVYEIKNIISKPIEVVRNNNTVKKVLVPEVKQETVKTIEVKKIEPITVVRSNYSKELVIVKKNQEIIGIQQSRRKLS